MLRNSVPAAPALILPVSAVSSGGKQVELMFRNIISTNCDINSSEVIVDN